MSCGDTETTGTMAPFPLGGADSSLEQRHDIVRDKMVRTCSPNTTARVRC